MAISSVQEIGPVVYSGKKEEGGLLTKWKVAQDTSESEEMLSLLNKVTVFIKKLRCFAPLDLFI